MRGVERRLSEVTAMPAGQFPAGFFAITDRSSALPAFAKRVRAPWPDAPSSQQLRSGLTGALVGLIRSRSAGFRG